MRISAFALLALAFARPFFAGKGPATAWGSQPKAVVVLLDASFSMGFEGGREKALEQAADVLSSLRTGDKVTVMQFGETTRTLVEAGKEPGGVLEQVEAGYEITNQGTEYGQALLAAEAVLFESPFEAKEIY
ncbi:MAG: VWA domain-containing protein, partial [Calditrichaeota bacterium]